MTVLTATRVAGDGAGAAAGASIASLGFAVDGVHAIASTARARVAGKPDVGERVTIENMRLLSMDAYRWLHGPFFCGEWQSAWAQ